MERKQNKWFKQILCILKIFPYVNIIWFYKKLLVIHRNYNSYINLNIYISYNYQFNLIFWS